MNLYSNIDKLEVKLQENLDLFLQNIARLKTEIPTHKIDNVYSEKEELNYRMAIVFLHSEFEDFIETTVLEYSEWIDTYHKREFANEVPLLSLFMLLSSAKTESMGFATLSNPKQLLEKWEQIITNYQKAIGKNHGIMKDHIEKLFGPTGYLLHNANILDVTEYQLLEQLKKNRGEYAHKRIMINETKIDPNALLNTINQLTALSESLIRSFLKYVKECSCIII